MSTDKLKEALEHIPYGVSVVTVGRGGAENALTISWLTQVSFDPAHLVIAVRKTHFSSDFLQSTKSFVVNLLSEDQAAVAGHFAKGSMTGEQKLEGYDTRAAPSGAPILEKALAYFDCEVVESHDIGDHTMFIGRIEEGGMLNPGKVLTSASGLRYRDA